MMIGFTQSRLRTMPTLLALLLGALLAPVPALAAAEPLAVQQRMSGVVTADSLPTAQINGVAWIQLIVGDTVYVGGQFTRARPAGSAPGQNEVVRNNLLAYNLTTGVLINSFAPDVNADVRALAISSDGTQLYAGGNFTAIGGVTVGRIAALNPTTGARIPAFAATVNSTVKAIVATAGAVYVGGGFTTANNVKRTRLAAFTTANGALTAWAPTADSTVQAMVMSPDGTKLVLGGAFLNLGITPAIGIGAVSASTGTVLPWNTNAVVRNGGTGAAVLSLSTDGTSIYGAVYKFNATGLEGTFKIDPAQGNVQWIDDCHGDVYGVYASPAALYKVGHSHYCGNDMGWPQLAVWNFNRAMAYTKDATGTLTRDPFSNGYTNFGGQPSPSIIQWFPKVDVGTFTGTSQGAWTVTGNASYVVLGGEFPKVNGVAQQGLARFAVEPIAPGTRKVELSGASFVPTLTSPTAGTARIRFLANWDRDDRHLTYAITRNGGATPIFTTAVDSSEWDRPSIGYLDTGLTPGQIYSYRLSVTDGDGNRVQGNLASILIADSGGPTGYGQTVWSQGANLYWPLNDTGSAARDYAGFNDGVLDTGVTTGTAGAIAGDTAMTFSGTAGGNLSSSGTLTPPDTFSAEVWFNTTSAKGGRILGFSDLPTGKSAHRDRHIYLSNGGRVNFGVYSGSPQVITSAGSYADGQWHQAVATLSSAGMQLYIDGVQVAANASVTSGEKYIGYWRIGGDYTGWPNAGMSGYLAGSLDEVSIYPTALTQAQIMAQYVASGRGTAAARFDPGIAPAMLPSADVATEPTVTPSDGVPRPGASMSDALVPPAPPPAPAVPAGPAAPTGPAVPAGPAAPAVTGEGGAGTTVPATAGSWVTN